MKLPKAVGFVLLGCLLVLRPGRVRAEASAQQILDRIDDLYRSRSAHGQMSMKVVNPNYQRQLVMEFWTLGTDKTLIRILEPLKERRTATLKNGNNIWNYLPKVDRTIKIPSSMMGGSWMGSDFTNDDLVKEYRMAVDYNPSITFRGKRGDQSVIEITCTPRPQAPVVWGKLVVNVREPDLVPLEILYYKENGALVRRLAYSEVRELGGRRLPTKMTMVPVDKPGHSTEVFYRNIEFDPELSRDLFSVARLRD